MGKKVRQGCPPSPSLFMLLLADLEKEMIRRDLGEIMLKTGNTLGYTDNVVIMTVNEEGINELMARLQRYLKKKRLEINKNKIKIK